MGQEEWQGLGSAFKKVAESVDADLGSVDAAVKADLGIRQKKALEAHLEPETLERLRVWKAQQAKALGRKYAPRTGMSFAEQARGSLVRRQRRRGLV